MINPMLASFSPAMLGAIGKFIKDLPPFFHDEYFGIELWKYISLMIFFVLGTIAYMLLQKLTKGVVISLTKNSKYQESVEKYILPVCKPFSALLVIFFFFEWYPTLKLPRGLSQILDYCLKGLLPLTLTVLFYRLTNLASDIIMRIASHRSVSLNENIVPLLRKALKVVILIFGGVYTLQSIGIDITPLIAGVSIGGLAFALAAQDTVKNLFGSITIYSDKPFVVGDMIVFDGSQGKVEEIGLRSTRIRTLTDSVITIPNGKIADLKIDNLSRKRFSLFNPVIAITYDTPTELIEKFVEGIREILSSMDCIKDENYNVFLNQLSEKSLNIMIDTFLEVPDVPTDLALRQEIILKIKQLAEDLNIRFAYPLSDYSRAEINK